MNRIEDIEKRFLEVTKINVDLSKFPIRKDDSDNQQQKTSKESSKEFGFVTTPIFLVDIMVSMKKDLNPEMTTLDVCAGCGQFSIRMLRYLYNRFNIDVEDWLKNKHNFNELQLENCANLIYIFGNSINLFCGDAKMLNLLNEDDHGLMFFDEKEKKWNHNDLLDKILRNEKIIKRLDILKKLFKIKDDEEKLQIILDKLV